MSDMDLHRWLKNNQAYLLVEHKNCTTQDCLYRETLEMLANANARIAELEALAPRWKSQGESSTHWVGCWKEHRLCALSRIAELEAERDCTVEGYSSTGTSNIS